MAALGDPDLDGEVAAHATGWAANPALVAVLPETARARVLPVLEPAVAGKQGLRLSGGPAAAAVVLTPRQTDVLERLASERTLADIADELFLGVETVRSTSKAVYKKLGVHSREEAVRTARLSGLLVPGEHDETAGQR
nr:LuxR C-terminal-related transcriptional regulator [Actinomyces radicidentis]